MIFRIPVPAEFSFEYSLAFLERSPKELLHSVMDRKVRKMLKVDNQHVVFTIAHQDDQLIVEVLNKPSVSNIDRYITAYINEWFDLGTNMKPFYALAKQDKFLHPIAKKYHGYRIIGQPDLFESLIWAVLGQQINVPFAYSIKQKLVEKYGERHTHEGVDYYLFPTPEQFIRITTDELLAMQFSRQKANYTLGIARAFVDKVISKEMFQDKPLEQAKLELVKIKGIGNWTANYALMRTFRYPNAFPLEDVALHKALQINMNMRKRPTLDRVKNEFKRYKGWEAYATIYYWKTL